EGRAWIVSTGLPEASAKGRQIRARRRLDQMSRRLEAVDIPDFTPCAHERPLFPGVVHKIDDLPGVVSNFDRSGYLAAVQRVIDYIHAGDCFQVNLSQRLLHPTTVAPLELYDRLRRRNPAPFAGYFDLGEFVLASASPERFLRVADSLVETRPI